MDPTDQHISNETIESNPSVNPSPSPETHNRSRARLLSIVGLAVLVLVLVGVLLLAHHNNAAKKTANTNPSYVSSVSNSNNRSIAGIAVNSKAVSQYTRDTATTDVLTAAQKAQQAQGLDKFYTLEGGVNYYLGDTTSGDLASIEWGSLGSDWNLDNYMNKGQAYLQANTPGSTSTLRKDGSVQVKASDGKYYSVPCIDLDSTNASDPGADLHIFSCVGPMGSSKHFVSFVVNSKDNTIASGKNLLQTFLRNITVEFK